MKKHQPQTENDGQQMFQISDQKPQSIQIGTQIFDPNLPSDLDFQDNKVIELEGKPIHEGIGQKQLKGNTKINLSEDIKSYSIKGKINFTRQPKYKCASYLKGHVDTFQVKAYDEQKSRGIKSIWQSLIGYTKRQICFQDGYMYIFEKTKEGYLTHSAFKLVDLLKVFVDHQQSQLRFIFHVGGDNHRSVKNFQVKSCSEFIEKVIEEAGKIGLMVLSD